MPNDIEFFRNEALRLTEAAGPTGQRAETLLRQLRQTAFHDLSAEELAKTLDYLKGKGLITDKPSELHKGTVRWVLTAQGRDYLEAEGLID